MSTRTRSSIDVNTAPLPRASAAWAYFLDVDGTLLDFRPTPGSVCADPMLRELLATTRGLVDGAFAVISGRSIADLDAVLDVPGLPAAGQHGAERRDARGVRVPDATDPTALDAARDALKPALRRHPRLLLEDKGQSLALHYRQTPLLATFAHRALREALLTLGARYHMIEGNCVVELRPANANKGEAIRAFMNESPFRGRRPVFIGDDVTDEDGFIAVNYLGGISVKVGGGPTAATGRLPNVESVRTWLQSMSDAEEMHTL